MCQQCKAVYTSSTTFQIKQPENGVLDSGLKCTPQIRKMTFVRTNRTEFNNQSL